MDLSASFDQFAAVMAQHPALWGVLGGALFGLVFGIVRPAGDAWAAVVWFRVIGGASLGAVAAIAFLQFGTLA